MGGVIAHHVQDGTAALPGIVQIGPAIGEAGAEMQERGRQLAAHPGVAIGSPGGPAFEQAEDAAHVEMRVERRDEAHLRRAGIGEAHLDARGEHRFHQDFCTIHGLLSRVRRRRRRGALDVSAGRCDSHSRSRSPTTSPGGATLATERYEPVGRRAQPMVAVGRLRVTPRAGAVAARRLSSAGLPVGSRNGILHQSAGLCGRACHDHGGGGLGGGVCAADLAISRAGAAAGEDQHDLYGCERAGGRRTR